MIITCFQYLQWVELSLSQVLVAWSIERHLDAARIGLLRHTGEEAAENESTCTDTEQSKLESINQTIPGLQALEDMILVASELPHPAIVRVECRSMLRATVLATHTLDLLNAILSTIAPKMKTCGGVDIVRYAAPEGASLVNIGKDNTSDSNCVRVESMGRGKELKDQPTSSPEYIAVFGLNRESHKSSIDSPQNMFFKHVFSGIEQDTFAFSQALSQIKNARPSLFQRHLVFVVKASRYSRILMTYNAHPQLRVRLEIRFKEIDQAAAKAECQYLSALQNRCLRHISFLPTNSLKSKSANETPITKVNDKISEKEDLNAESVVKREPTRRIPRPTTMLRPTLIGKSIEGSAMQAVAARRLKASSGPVVLQRAVSGSAKTTIATVVGPRGEKPVDKPISLERIVSGSGSATLALLKSAQLTSPGYRLQRRFLSPSTFIEGSLLDSCKKQTLVEHLRADCKKYHLSCSGTGDDICFSGKLEIASFAVHYYIAWQESVADALDVFILCVTNGQFIDGYITKAGSLYAERTLDVISYTTMTAVREIIESAAKAVRKNVMWKFFANDCAVSQGPRESFAENIAELRRFSHHVDMVTVDPRLTALLHDDSGGLRLSWPYIFDAIAKSPSLFSRCTAFESGETSTYLVYCKGGDDLILDFIVSPNDHNGVEVARILTKEHVPRDLNSDAKVPTAVRSAVGKFVMFLLQWLRSDCENNLDS